MLESTHSFHWRPDWNICQVIRSSALQSKGFYPRDLKSFLLSISYVSKIRNMREINCNSRSSLFSLISSMSYGTTCRQIWYLLQRVQLLRYMYHISEPQTCVFLPFVSQLYFLQLYQQAPLWVLLSWIIKRFCSRCSWITVLWFSIRTMLDD